MNDAVTLDTHAYFKKLVEAGMPKEQASAVVVVYTDILKTYLVANGQPLALDTYTWIKKLVEVGLGKELSETIVRGYARVIQGKFDSKGELKTA